MIAIRKIFQILESKDTKSKEGLIVELSKNSSGIYEHGDGIYDLIWEKGNIERLIEIGNEHSVKLLALMFDHSIIGDDGGGKCIFILEERYKDCKELCKKLFKNCLNFLKSIKDSKDRVKLRRDINFAYEIIYRLYNIDWISIDIKEYAETALQERNKEEFSAEDNKSIGALLKGWKRAKGV